MKLYELLDEQSVALDLAGRGKNEAIAELVDLLARAGRISDRDGVMAALLAREAQQSTGIGCGVAVPHAKHASIEKLTAAVGFSRTGVEFEAVDGQPVRAVFLLMARVDEPGPHVRALAEIARLVQIPGLVDRLASRRTPADIVTAVAAEE